MGVRGMRGARAEAGLLLVMRESLAEATVLPIFNTHNPHVQLKLELTAGRPIVRSGVDTS